MHLKDRNLIKREKVGKFLTRYRNSKGRTRHATNTVFSNRRLLLTPAHSAGCHKRVRMNRSRRAIIVADSPAAAQLATSDVRKEAVTHGSQPKGEKETATEKDIHMQPPER